MSDDTLNMTERRPPRVIVVVEGGARQLIGIYPYDEEVPLHTGELELYNPLNFVGADPRQNPDGFAFGPLMPLVPVDEILVNASSVWEVEKDSKIYQKYQLVAEEIYKMQAAASAGLVTAREMPKGPGGPIIGGR